MRKFDAAGYKATHFDWTVDGKVATLTLNRPEKKNPLTFESYGELRDLFQDMVYATDVRRSSSPGRAAIFAQAGMYTRSSARSRRWICQVSSNSPA